MPGVFGAIALAGRFPLSAVRWWECMAGPQGAAGMLGVRCADFGNGGNHLPGHTNSPAGLVSRHVVGNDAKERRQRTGIAASAGAEEL